MTIPKINSAHGSDTRNILNRAIDIINVQGKSIQDLVAKGQLTPAQYAELIQAVNGLVSKGEISVDDINKNLGKLDSTFFSESFLNELSNGDINVTNLLDGSVTSKKIASSAITASKVEFLKKSDNLFDGEYSAFAMNYNSQTNSVQYRAAVEGEKVNTAIIELNQNQTYTIKTHDPSLTDRFFAGILNSAPTIGGGFQPVDTTLFYEGDNTKAHTFTNTSEGKYLMVYVSNKGNKPRLQVEFGEKATEYKPPYVLDGISVGVVPDRFSLSELPFYKKSVNIFDGNYTHMAAQILNGTPTYRISNDDKSLISAIVEVESNQKYTIKIHEKEKSNRFVVLGFKDELPESDRGWTEADFGFVDDRSLHKFTVDVPNNIKFLLIYVSNEGKKPLLQVEKGSIDTPYYPYMYISEDYIPSLGNLDNTKHIDSTAKYNIFDEIPKDYVRPENLQDVGYNSNFNIQETTHNDVYGWYDNLMNEFPDYITRTLLGYATGSDGSENRNYPIYEYNFKPLKPVVGLVGYPPSQNDNAAVYPRLLITSSVHGNEKLGVWTTYQIMKDICENADNRYFAEFFRYNVEIRVVPLVNPGGYTATTRENLRGVNINRNFETNWDGTQQNPGQKAMSELESQIMDRWFNKFKDETIAHIDVHNISGVHPTPQGQYGFVWIISTDEKLRTLGMHTLSTLSRKWLREIQSFESFPKNIMLGNVSSYAGGMMMEYAKDKYNIPSIVSDPERNASYYPNMTPNGTDLLKINIDSLGAIMVGIMKSIGR